MSKQREEFEEWLKLDGYDHHSFEISAFNEENYHNDWVQFAWQAWQQAQKVAVPEWLSEHIDVNFDDQREDDQHSYWSGYNQALREIKAMIEAGEKK